MDLSLTIGWLYPELMSTYGDRGNIICLKKRCLWRGIKVDVFKIDFEASAKDISSCDLIFGGGAQDREQGLLANDLRDNKGKILKKLFDHGVPGLFVCGSPQLLGHYYMTGDGKKLKGLGIFDMVTKHFGKNKPRCIGNTVGLISSKFKIKNSVFKKTIVGFENHGGRTYLGSGAEPFAKVQKGCGNNGEDKTEGALYKNCLACYYHGPFLPKNPHIADWLILKALEVKYKKDIVLPKLDDSLEWRAHEYFLALA